MRLLRRWTNQNVNYDVTEKSSSLVLTTENLLNASSLDVALVATSNGGRSPSSGFPNCPRPQLPAPHSKNSQRLNRRSPPTNSLTHQQILFTNSTNSSLVLLITSRHGPRRKHRSSVAMQSLSWNCCVRFCWRSRCIVAYFAVVVQ
jgi:hypothetical protein